MSKKIAIVGFAPSTRDLAPYNDPEWEIWVLNQYQSILPQGGATNITRWFELHQRDTVLTNHRDAEYFKKLKESKIPVMMCKKEEDIPMSEAYPLEEIIEACETDYFTNTISYMAAYAYYIGATEVAIYGVDMAQDEEYAKERPSVEYFVAFLRAKGIPVYIPAESDICKAPYLYGFQEETASKICKTIDPKKEDLVKRIANDDFQVDEMMEHIDYQLKNYLFDYKPKIEHERNNETIISELAAKLQAAQTEEERQEIIAQLQEIQKNSHPLKDLLFPMDTLFMKLWEHNQSMKAAKKERLYLAGANDISGHLRKILCPFD